MKEASILDSIKIAKPCSADWNEMVGDDRLRFCGACRLNVYSLSGMSETEVENFLIESEGRVCVQLYRRNDGTLITENCLVGLAAARLRIRRFATAFASIVMSFLFGSGITRIVNGPSSERPAVYVPAKEEQEERSPKISFGGLISNLDEVKESILRDQTNA